MKRFLTVCIILVSGLILTAPMSFAEGKSYSLGYEISKEPSGIMKLTINTSALASGLWLGVTFYTPDAMTTENHIFPIKLGKGVTEMVINPKFVNGTFEAAVWTKRLSIDECAKTDDFCQKNGYKATGMVAYIWRYITSP
ncbi:MAG: hypothetical protein HY807_09720 [Nitrospirae bacterium]|nr:hypothetical protein [Nitrospirota bacterium]